MTILIIAALGLAGFSILKARQAEAKAVAPGTPTPQPAAAPPAPDLGNLILGTAVQVFTEVQAAGAEVGTWDERARRFIEDGQADELILQSVSVDAVMNLIFEVVGPSPGQWFTSDPVPSIKFAVQNRISLLIPEQGAIFEAERLEALRRAAQKIFRSISF